MFNEVFVVGTGGALMHRLHHVKQSEERKRVTIFGLIQYFSCRGLVLMPVVSKAGHHRDV